MKEDFLYVQRSGRFATRNGDDTPTLAVGYAGFASGRNNPEKQSVRSTGPLPVGVYTMRIVEHPRFARPAIRLEQVEGETFGRSAFYIHGDNRTGTASTGCIILGRSTREHVARAIRAGRKRLRVIADEEVQDDLPF